MKSKKVKVQTPEMGVVNDLISHGKKLVKKHGAQAVSKVGEHLKSYSHEAISKAGDHVTKKVKDKLPKILHKQVDGAGNALKEFGKKAASTGIDGGVSKVQGRINKK